MPFLTTTGGLNFSYPTDGTTNWGSTLKTSFNTISAHNHTGAPNGVQLGTNSLQNNAIIGSKFRLLNDTFLRGRNAADSADINILKVTTGDVLQFGNGTSNATISAANITLSGSGTISSSGPFVFPAGTVSAPSVTFTGDLNTGFYNIAADTIGAATNGVERVRVDTAAVTSTLPYVAPAGTVSAPSLTFASDLNTGFYQIAADTIGVATAGAERIRVDSSGNVGIGGTPSGYKFHLQTDGNDIFAGYTYNTVDGNALRMWRARGTAASPSAVQTNDTLASLRGFGYSSAGAFGVAGAAIDLQAAENFTGTAQGGQIIFRTTTNGTAIAATERVRIDNAGNVGIGTTTPNFSGFGTTNLTVAGASTLQAAFELVGNRADLDAQTAGVINFFANSNSAGNKLISTIRSLTDGTTASNRGGRLAFEVKQNNGSAITALTITQSGQLQVNSTSGNPCDVTSSTNAIVRSISTNGYASFLRNASSGNPSYDFYQTAGTETARVSVDSSSNYTIHTGSAATARMVILSTGDVGIGVSSTGGYRVAVVGSAVSSKTLYLHTDASRAYVYSPDEMAIGSTGAQALIFVTSNTERARITSGGGFTCAGVYSTIVGGTNRDVFVDSGGVVGYVSSLRDSKTEIENLTDISWLYQLNPVSFKYRKRDENGAYTDEADGDIQYGMIAEDVQPIRPDLCFYDEVDGRQELRGIQYSKLTAVLLKAVQDLKAEIETLKAQVTPQ